MCIHTLSLSHTHTHANAHMCIHAYTHTYAHMYTLSFVDHSSLFQTGLAEVAIFNEKADVTVVIIAVKVGFPPVQRQAFKKNGCC